MKAKAITAAFLMLLTVKAYSQTDCDSLFINIAGINSAQKLKRQVDIKLDIVKGITRFYLNDTSYRIVRFTTGECLRTNYMVYTNEGPAFNTNVLYIFKSMAQSGDRLYFYDFVLADNNGTQYTCPNLNYVIHVK